MSYNSPLLSLAMIAIFAASARAQGGFQVPLGLYGGVPALVAQPAVQQELKLNRKQLAKAGKLVQSAQQGHQNEFFALQQLAPAQRREKLVVLIQSISDESFVALKDVLDAEQLKRLKQIDLQFRGPRAFRDAEVRAQLKLSDEQQERIQMLASDTMRAITDIVQDASLNRAFMLQKIQIVRQATLEKVVAVLTDEQKKAWQEMLGAPFGQ